MRGSDVAAGGWATVLAGLLACVVWAEIPAAAQTSDPSDQADPTPPLPPTRPVSTPAKYRVPNPDRVIFQGFRDPHTLQQIGGIEDMTPVASEQQNRDEYEAWHELIFHARQFATSELIEHARRDIVRDELIENTRHRLRLELIRFDGYVVQVRRVPATARLQQAEVPEIYEAILELLDEPPTDRLSFVFIDLPEALAPLRQRPPGEWYEVRLPAIVAGYFFKVKPDPTLPILIGRGLELPAAAPENIFHNIFLDKNLRIFRRIQNDTVLARGPDQWEESVAWHRVLLHANRFSCNELEQAGRSDLTFADLYYDGYQQHGDGRRDFKGPRDYLLELVQFEGRLVMLKRITATRKLRDAGIEQVFEGWIVPRDEPRGNPICFVFTEPLVGVEPAGRINVWVSGAGYYFKLMRYESAERDPHDPTQRIMKRAPLLLGRGLIRRPDPELASPVSWATFARYMTVFILAVIAAALALSWWYRRGDRYFRQTVESQRKNPFEGTFDHPASSR